MRQTWEREGCHRPNALCVAEVSQSTKLNLNLWGPFSGNRMNWRSLQRVGVHSYAHRRPPAHSPGESWSFPSGGRELNSPGKGGVGWEV